MRHNLQSRGRSALWLGASPRSERMLLHSWQVANRGRSAVTTREHNNTGRDNVDASSMAETRGDNTRVKQQKVHRHTTTQVAGQEPAAHNCCFRGRLPTYTEHLGAENHMQRTTAANPSRLPTLAELRGTRAPTKQLQNC